MLALGEHSSMTERRADDATRDVLAWLKCEFLEDRVGEAFDAVIAAVTSFGLFVELEGLYIEGLVHITALGQDYYQFDPARQRLVGERTRRRFQLGDRVRVQVLRVDVEERKIDLGLADAGAALAAPKRRSRTPRRDTRTEQPDTRGAARKSRSGKRRRR